MNINKSKILSYWVIGKHAVVGALNNPDRINYRLCITAENYEKIQTNNIKLEPEIMSRTEISKLTNKFFILHIDFASLSLICLLSSLKCIVMESAPDFFTNFAATTGLGCSSPRAFLNVAI